jgi:hypothetical protein
MKQFISLALLGVCLLALLPSQASGAYYPRVPQVGTISDKTMGPNKDHPWGVTSMLAAARCGSARRSFQLACPPWIVSCAFFI